MTRAKAGRSRVAQSIGVGGLIDKPKGGSKIGHIPGIWVRKRAVCMLLGKN